MIPNPLAAKVDVVVTPGTAAPKGRVMGVATATDAPIPAETGTGTGIGGVMIGGGKTGG